MALSSSLSRTLWLFRVGGDGPEVEPPILSTGGHWWLAFLVQGMQRIEPFAYQGQSPVFPKAFPIIDIFLVTFLQSRIIVLLLEARKPKHQCSQKHLLPVEEWAKPHPEALAESPESSEARNMGNSLSSPKTDSSSLLLSSYHLCE